MRRLLPVLVFLCAPAAAAQGDAVSMSSVNEADDTVPDAAETASSDEASADEAPDQNPGWKNPWVAEMSPNLYGQTGIIRTTSAAPGKGGYFDIGVHGRGFYLPDFVAEGADENAMVAGMATFGFTLFDLVELGLAAQLASNSNSVAEPPTAISTGDFMPSLKVGYAFGPVAVGFDVRGLLPAGQGGVGPDLDNFAVSSAGLLTLDLYGPYDLPLRVHLNGGYTFQFARFGADAGQRYYLRGLQGQLIAMTANAWFYDQAFYGLGIELPFPFVTPYVELWGQTALGVIDGFGVGGGAYTPVVDGHLTATPGVRISLGRGFSIDLGADIGILGTGGYFSPTLDQLTEGQPLNPAYAVHLGVSYTFNPFLAEQRVVTRTAGGGGGEPLGVVEGCVASASSQGPIEGAYVEIAGEQGMRLATDGTGCFRSGMIGLGTRTVTITHPDFQARSMSVDVVPATPARADAALMPKEGGGATGGGGGGDGMLRGTVVDANGKPVSGKLELASDEGGSATADVKDGQFETRVAPGRWQVLVRVDGQLLQGAYAAVPDGGRAVLAFELKPKPNKRIALKKGDEIKLRARVPFAGGEARMLPAAGFILDDVVDLLLSDESIPKLKVIGVTGGGQNAGEDLARARAEAVVDYLVKHGVRSARIEADARSKKKAKRRDKGGLELAIVGGDG